MKLKNILIVVKDIEKSKQFYHDLFGLNTVLDNDGNMILTEGLVLQDEKIWKKFLEQDIVPKSNSCELYFEEQDIEAFIEKLEKLYPSIQYVNRLMTHSWGQKMIRFYDLDGNLIEVRTPMSVKTEMKFILECDEMDGLVFIDKSYLAELNSDMLYAMDILLDPYGESELVFDFPNETWETVRLRETKHVREFCKHGKMIIWLFDSAEKECKIEESREITDSPKWLHIPTGKLLAVTASELIQCLSYPELEMKKIFELEVEGGWYAIWNEGIDKIMYCRKEPPRHIPSNIQEMY